MTWTKKHDEFCLKQKLRPSTKLLLCWILRRVNQYQVTEIEIDLRAFNSWVAKKRGTPFDRKTVKEAINQIDESTNGLVLITKDYSPWIKKLIVRPLSLVTQKKPPETGIVPKINDSNPMYSAEQKKASREQQQQNISKLDTLLTKVGLKYDRDALHRIWILADKTMANITQSVEFLLFRHSTQRDPIGNPEGLLITCLRRKLYEGFNLYYQTELPYFHSGSNISSFVGGLLDGTPTRELSKLTLPDKSPIYQTLPDKSPIYQASL